MIRRQLPAYSPQSPVLMWRASRRALKSPERVRSDFRRYLCSRFGADEALLTGSGTQALQLALTMVRASRGDTAVVALPAYTCYDVVTAAAGADVNIVFYDIDPNTLTPDAQALRRALSVGATAVVAASLFGFPLDWTWLRRECQDAGAVLIEDSAQGLGSSWRGAEGGGFGDLTVLSFGRGKGWTGGSGGALLMRCARSGAREGFSMEGSLQSPGRLSGFRSVVVSGALWMFGRPMLYRLPTSIPGLGLGKTEYREPIDPTEISAYAAAAALQHADVASRATDHRRRVAVAWRRMIEEHSVSGDQLRACQPLLGGDAGYLRFPALARDSGHALALSLLARRFGVTRGYPRALPELPASRRLNVSSWRSQSGAQTLVQRLVTLPTHPRVSELDLAGLRSLL